MNRVRLEELQTAGDFPQLFLYADDLETYLHDSYGKWDEPKPEEPDIDEQLVNKLKLFTGVPCTSGYSVIGLTTGSWTIVEGHHEVYPVSLGDGIKHRRIQTENRS